MVNQELKKYKDSYWKKNIKCKELKKYLNQLLVDINDTNITKENLYKKIRILECGKCVETFTIQCLRVFEDSPEKGYIQFKRLGKNAIRHVHFKDNIDIIITTLTRKGKKLPSIIIDVHGDVYYPDGSRRYNR